MKHFHMVKIFHFPSLKHQNWQQTPSEKEWKSWRKSLLIFNVSRKVDNSTFTVDGSVKMFSRCEIELLSHSEERLKVFPYEKKGRRRRREIFEFSEKGAPAVRTAPRSALRAHFCVISGFLFDVRIPEILAYCYSLGVQEFEVECVEESWKNVGKEIVNRFQLINGFIFSLKIDFNRFFWFESPRRSWIDMKVNCEKQIIPSLPNSRGKYMTKSTLERETVRNVKENEKLFICRLKINFSFFSLNNKQKSRICHWKNHEMSAVEALNDVELHLQNLQGILVVIRSELVYIFLMSSEENYRKNSWNYNFLFKQFALLHKRSDNFRQHFITLQSWLSQFRCRAGARTSKQKHLLLLKATEIKIKINKIFFYSFAFLHFASFFLKKRLNSETFSIMKYLVKRNFLGMKNLLRFPRFESICDIFVGVWSPFVSLPRLFHWEHQTCAFSVNETT